VSKEQECALEALGTNSFEVREHIVAHRNAYLETVERQIQQLSQQANYFLSMNEELEALSVHKKELSHLRLKIPLLTAEFKLHVKELETQVGELSGVPRQLKDILDETLEDVAKRILSL